jgi:hypothetical protein
MDARLVPRVRPLYFIFYVTRPFVHPRSRGRSTDRRLDNGATRAGEKARDIISIDES